MNNLVISLLTDFGLKDAYVGILKGVIARFAPHALVIDICHEVPPQDIQRAGVLWASAVPHFPPGTVHVAVVDPGVGTERRILAFEARNCLFLAPDNGLIGYACERREIRKVVSVQRTEHFLQPLSGTFHGRDIFAPVAARLASGLPLEALGPRTKRYLHRSLPRPSLKTRRAKGSRITEARGEIVAVDRFGNAITNLQPLEGQKLLELRAGGFRWKKLSRAYGDVKKGRSVVLVESTGHLEIAVSHGRADVELGLKLGDPVAAVWVHHFSSPMG